VPFEVAAVLAIAVMPFPEALPVALPLMVAGTLSRWIRRRSWAELTQSAPPLGTSRRAGIGLLAGVLALVIAVLIGAREATAVSPIPLGGSVKMAAIAMLHVGVTALAAELALRGWIVERVLELAPRSGVLLPVLVGALAEALVTPGDGAARLGGALFGAGLGWMFVTTNRNLVVPIFARVAFQAGAVAIEALGLV
jgi:hypothetical protein